MEVEIKSMYNNQEHDLFDKPPNNETIRYK